VLEVGSVKRLRGTSGALVKKVLAAMREEGVLALKGRGRGARWRVKGPKT
jgi:hypothetical protein